MKFRFIITIVICFVSFNSISYPWGDKSHILINGKAMFFLPAEMSGLKKWGNYIAEHAPDPDKRKEYDSTEFPKHFIDLDFYPEFNNGNMLTDMNQLIAIYGDSTVNGLGTLPWSTIETLNNLTAAFKALNRDKILIFASDLGHYVADGHQPLHAILNYDGQLSGQEGIHGRYEWQMIDRFISEIDSSIDSFEVSYVNNPADFIFSYITNANSISPVLLDADLQAYKTAGSRESDKYFNLLWYRTKYITKIQFNKAAQNFASLVYTAWINAGKPVLDKLQ